jgi:hypothetical protein
VRHPVGAVGIIRQQLANAGEIRSGDQPALARQPMPSATRMPPRVALDLVSRGRLVSSSGSGSRGCSAQLAHPKWRQPQKAFGGITSVGPPVAFAGFRVEADEGAAVEAVNVPFVEEHVVLVGPWMERRRPCTANDSGRSIGVDERADPFHDINQKVVVIKLCYKRHTAITVVERLYLMGV